MTAMPRVLSCSRLLISPVFLLLFGLADVCMGRSLSEIDSVTAEFESAKVANADLTEFISVSVEASEAEGLSRLSDALESLRENLRIVGMSAAVIQEQKLVWARGFGQADLEHGVAATPTTPYSLASLSKPFGAVLMFQLCERGEVDLGDPASKYGIEFESPGVIRLAHLMSHTSEGVPGSAYKYNGDRFGSLDRVLWSVSGMSFTEAATDAIIEPLGLDDTGFNPLDTAVLDKFLDFRESRGEPRAVFDPHGEPYPLGEVSLRDPNILTTGGSLETLMASVVDDSLFNLNLVPRLPVDEATVASFKTFWSEWSRADGIRERMARPYVISDAGEPERGIYDVTVSCAAGVLSSVVDLARFDAAIDWNLLVGPELQELAMTPTVSTDGDTLPYGLGWFIHEYRGRKIVWHYGFWNSSSTLMVKVPEAEMTFVLLANTDALSRPFGIGGDSDVLVSPAAELFLRHVVFSDGGSADMDWTASIESIEDTLAAADDPVERDLLAYEIRAAAGAARAGLLTSHTAEELMSALDTALAE